MSTTNKTVDCSIHPTELRPNQDITGIGVSLAWTITAGLALCLVVANYFVAYRPDINPFGSHHPNPGRHAQFTFKSNPIDEQLLGWRLKRLRQVGHTSASTQDRDDAQARRDRIRDALTQLITGLSVLISGYSQLPSGISAMHWERVIDLAWFSSITHLCCLTFLRDHFRQNRRARIWRIPGMVILIVLLSVALIPSSNYIDSRIIHPGYEFAYNPVFDYAICFFKYSEERSRGYHYGDSEWERQVEIKKQNTIISAIILIFGMANRIWRLFETSTIFYLSAKRWLSQHVKKMLRSVLKETTSRSAILMCLIYRPLLASYLLTRMLLDILLSRAFEIWWLAVGLAWGLTNLLPISEPDDHEWTFGQVIASLMLVAPVVALVETLVTTTYQSQPNSTIPPQDHAPDQQLLPNPPSISSTRLIKDQSSREDPDFDFYNLSLAFTVTPYVILAFIASMSVIVIVIKAGWDDLKLLEMMWTMSEESPNILFLAHVTISILCSLSIDQHTPETRFGRITVRICSSMLIAALVVGGFVMGVVGRLWGYCFIIIEFGVYLILLVVEMMLNRRHSLKSAPLPAAHANGSALSLESVPATSTSTGEPAQDQSTTAPVDGPSMNLPSIDTSSAFGPPRRQDTEAEIGVTLTRANTT
ncbi:hypothetical protein C7974DRAFT_469157 [Boeremia exigua]|uniref:uncharacterized protein n=1 Tax=Boeremia exigua TaxID=749465 RepID=UPI001E8D4449|nr:uncharacterized protein C7974DRAFT_469157 [Boeremia exigua]KAH6642917.1 hypothetical protein C7974DRAFT_469157 [Boeremia exigua]